MKKVLRTSALMLTGMALVAGSAQAASVGVYRSSVVTTPAPLLVANEIVTEAVASGNIADVGTVAGGIGDMIVTTSYVSSDSLTLTLDNNALFSAPTGLNDYLLFVWSDSNNDGIVDLGELSAVYGGGGLPVTATGAGTASLSWTGPFQMVSGGLLAAGSKLVVREDIAANVVTGVPTVALGNLNWEIAAPGMALDSAITVTAVDDKLGDINTSSTTFAQAMNEYVLCATTPFSAIIDLAPAGADPRTLFEAGTGATTTTTDDSQFVILDRNQVITNVAGMGCGDTTDYSTPGFSAVAAANTGSVDAIDGVLSSSANNQALGNADSMTIALNAGAAANSTFDTTTNTWPSGPTDVNAATVSSTTFVWLATVDGAAIDSRTFGFQVVSTPLAGYEVITYTLATGIDAGSWTYGDGYDAVVPYMPIGFDGYLSFLKLFNDNNMQNTVVVTGTCQNITDGTDEAQVVAATLADIPADSVRTYSEADLVAALGLDSAKQYHCALEVISDAPASLMQMEAMNKGPSGRTILHVLNRTLSALND